MLFYDFTVLAADANKPYEVTNPSGEVVSEGVVPAELTGDNEITISVELDEGVYSMRGTPGFPPGLTASNVLGVAASIAAGGGTAAPLTFVSLTGEVELPTSNGSGVVYTEFGLYNDEDTMPDWCTIDAGSIILAPGWQYHVAAQRSGSLVGAEGSFASAEFILSNGNPDIALTADLFSPAVLLDGLGSKASYSNSMGRVVNVTADSPYLASPALAAFAFDDAGLTVTDISGGETTYIQITKLGPVPTA